MKQSVKILLTGGLGYIGSHVAVDLLQNGYEVVIIDNLSNSCMSVAYQIEKISSSNFLFIEGDVLDYVFLENVFKSHNFNLIIHLAGLKSVPESFLDPDKYFHANIMGTLNLLKAMKSNSVSKIIFSSSAAIYGSNGNKALKESDLINPNSPYAESKYFIERILNSFSSAYNFSFLALRYFNPVGAHKSYLIGENPIHTSLNLMPIICDVALGKRDYLEIFGVDYETHDGTCIRDFIHISDLSNAHIKAANFLLQSKNKVSMPLNIGTGIGYSVLDLINQFKISLSIDIKYKNSSRRIGDVSISYANPQKAFETLNWKSTSNLSDMCIDSFNWQKKMRYI